MTPTAAPLSTLPPRERFLLWVLASVQFTHIVDFMVMMPLGPQFTRVFGLSDAQFGLLVSAYTLAAGASGLGASLFIDRFDRKRALLALYASFALATLACGLAPSYALLMAARVAAGLFGGVLGALVQTIVGDVVPYERRGRAMGIVMSAFSMSTVAGVPASLWLAGVFDWHAPFIAIALSSGLIWLGAARGVPSMQSHMAGPRDAAHKPWHMLRQVLSQRPHWHAFALSTLVMASSFSIIPYITIYMTANVGLQPKDVPLIYLIGGVATFFSSRLWGWMADRYGKVFTFRCVAVLAVLPMMALTHLPAVPLAAVIAVTTAFFVFVSGRMVPGMAIVASTAQPQWRGMFMSLNGSVQSAAMGAASYVGGALISRDGAGRVLGYGTSGWLALGCTLAAVVVAGRLHQHSAPQPGAVKALA